MLDNNSFTLKEYSSTMGGVGLNLAQGASCENYYL
jgi:hypothetical protein